MKSVTITHIDTACILIDINGYRILTDPTLDKAGQWYYHGAGSFSKKTESPAIAAEQLPPIDLVLLSHHQHKDNFDNNGKAFAMKVPVILSTKTASAEVSGITGLSNWQSFSVFDRRIGELKITATPAQHHPWWLPEFFSGEVIGFVIELSDPAKTVIYISGDTVYFNGIREIAKRFKVDVGIFHVGSVEFRYLTGFGRYTMNSRDLVKAVDTLDPKIIIPIHHKGWSHFKEKETALKNKIAVFPQIATRINYLISGEPFSIAL
jgi:L-ascorbate metabolism protein UlaG (beta-lactamase superfamily)